METYHKLSLVWSVRTQFFVSYVFLVLVFLLSFHFIFIFYSCLGYFKSSSQFIIGGWFICREDSGLFVYVNIWWSVIISKEYFIYTNSSILIFFLFQHKKLIDWIFYLTSTVGLVMFLAQALSFMVVYVWSRRNPGTILALFGLFQFSAPYLPWVFLLIGFLLDQNPMNDILGMVAGHIYFFFEDVYPLYRPNRRILATPSLLCVPFLF